MKYVKVEVRGQMEISRSVNVSCIKCSRHIQDFSQKDWKSDKDVSDFFKEKGWCKTKAGWLCPACNKKQGQNHLLRIPRFRYI